MVRIIAGEAKGATLRVPNASNTIRPTADRVKESLFSQLRGEIAGAKVLDLFCGSGNLGLEALSEGASVCWFVEQNRACVDCLKYNIGKLRYHDRAQVIAGDFFSRVRHWPADAKQFDIVFADPPYDMVERYFSDRKNVLNLLIEHDIVNPFTLFILEHSSAMTIPVGLTRYELLKSRRYGSTSISMIRCMPKEQDNNDRQTDSGCISG